MHALIAGTISVLVSNRGASKVLLVKKKLESHSPMLSCIHNFLHHHWLYVLHAKHEQEEETYKIYLNALLHFSFYFRAPRTPLFMVQKVTREKFTTYRPDLWEKRQMASKSSSHSKHKKKNTEKDGDKK